MYKLSVSESFSAAHRLGGYPGACKNLHGHNWKVRVTVALSELDEIGMALDITIMKDTLRGILKSMDHHYLNEVSVLQDMNPTSENLARRIYEMFTEALGKPEVKVLEVEVCESPRSSVVYSHD